MQILLSLDTVIDIFRFEEGLIWIRPDFGFQGVEDVLSIYLIWFFFVLAGE
jgi:hypothetical protein